MPFTPKQHRLFEAAAHDSGVASRVGIPQAKARMMASEGVKAKAKGYAKALRGASASKTPV